MQLAEAMKEKGVVMTSSPGPKLQAAGARVDGHAVSALALRRDELLELLDHGADREPARSQGAEHELLLEVGDVGAGERDFLDGHAPCIGKAQRCGPIRHRRDRFRQTPNEPPGPGMSDANRQVVRGPRRGFSVHRST
jgi:hypothetical protein